MRVHRALDHGRNRGESEPSIEEGRYGHLVRGIQHHPKRPLAPQRPIRKAQTWKSLVIGWVKLEPPRLAQVEGWERSIPSFRVRACVLNRQPHISHAQL